MRGESIRTPCLYLPSPASGNQSGFGVYDYHAEYGIDVTVI